MGQYANFYNSKNSDRTYDADSFSEILKPLFKDGVINGQMQVKTYSNMMVKVESGNCYIGGKHKYFENSTNLTIESANPTLDRIDNIVVRRNDTERDFILMVVKGSESRTPQAPIPVRGGGIYDLVLAQVYVNKATIRIEQSHITDTRMNSQLCGWVAGAVEQIAFEQVTAQFLDFFNLFKTNKTQEFESWFSGVQNSLSGDIATNLSNQLGQLASIVNAHNTSINRLENRIDERRYTKLTNKPLYANTSWQSVSKQQWDSKSEFLYRQKVNVSGMTADYLVVNAVFDTGVVEKIGMIETTSGGFYVYAKERFASTIYIRELHYFKN